MTVTTIRYEDYPRLHAPYDGLCFLAPTIIEKALYCLSLQVVLEGDPAYLHYIPT